MIRYRAKQTKQTKQTKMSATQKGSKATKKTKKAVLGCRVPSKCFTDGQRIRHTAPPSKVTAGGAYVILTWDGIYDAARKGIACNGKFYKSMSAFAEDHYVIARPDRVEAANGWLECECESADGAWISTYNL